MPVTKSFYFCPLSSRLFYPFFSSSYSLSILLSSFPIHLLFLAIPFLRFQCILLLSCSIFTHFFYLPQFLAFPTTLPPTLFHLWVALPPSLSHPSLSFSFSSLATSFSIQPDLVLFSFSSRSKRD